MKKILIFLPLCAFLTPAYAGFSIGMPGAVIKRVEKLDVKTTIKKSEWVLVPGSAAIGTSDFYVMKYEAKNVGGWAISQAAVPPWVNIIHTEAIAACSALGKGSHLLTIPEVQTINRNIEAQTANWANGTIGSLVSAGGGLKRGNVGVTDSASYGGGSVAEYGTGRNAKAKLVLSNGAEIWDWSGNVWEWIYGAGTNGELGTPDGVTFDSYGYEWNNATLNQERPIIGPSNSTWTSGNGVGTYDTVSPITSAVRRGGGWYDGTTAGVFAFGTAYASTYPLGQFGFRCAR